MLDILNTSDPCLTQEQLLDYIHNRLSAAEKHAVEEHLAGCDFCSDALEGLMALKRREQLPVIIQQIRRQFRKELKSHQGKSRHHQYYTWLAAVIFILLLILLIAYFSIQFTQRREMQQKTPPPIVDSVR